MMQNEIPRATAMRLPIYRRYLMNLKESGRDRISSTELSEAVKVDSATIRRDFSYFGALGKRGYGYDVNYLLQFFTRILSQDRLTNVGLIGVGHLGYALLNYNFRKNSNIRIGAAFDLKDELIGTIQAGVPVYSINDIEEQMQQQQLDVMILTVPEQAAEEVVARLIKAGVKGILNFTPIRLEVPEGIYVQNVDLTNELQILIYFIESNFGMGPIDSHI